MVKMMNLTFFGDAHHFNHTTYSLFIKKATRVIPGDFFDFLTFTSRNSLRIFFNFQIHILEVHSNIQFRSFL